MPNNIVEEIDPNTSINAHDLGAKEIEQLRDARWRARHDFFFLANTVLGKDLICPEFNGNLVNLLQKFTICEEIPESEWDKRTIAVQEDNNFETEPYFISIREAITGTEPQMIYTNNFSIF